MRLSENCHFSEGGNPEEKRTRFVIASVAKQSPSQVNAVIGIATGFALAMTVFLYPLPVPAAFRLLQAAGVAGIIPAIRCILAIKGTLEFLF